jgi:hypothetical protein
MSRHYIEDVNLSVAWARMTDAILRSSSSEVAPIVVSITGFGPDSHPTEDPTLRLALDRRLAARRRQPIETVASTIFPKAFWNPKLPRSTLYERYSTNLARLKRAHHLNRRGMYFERMTTGGPAEHRNQLEFAISGAIQRPGMRRSAFQLGIFQPANDHSRSARMGFPCLQHVTFAPNKDGLHINAFYAIQYAIERAYGNYLGLCRLGAFIAHELNLPMARVTCVAGVMQLDDAKNAVRAFVPTYPEDE